VYVVSEGDTLHGIAAKFYPSLGVLPRISAANLWWVIADFQPNPIHDPTIKLVAGQRLIIPSTRTVVNDILRRSNEF
jgi:LysM repeat protein